MSQEYGAVLLPIARASIANALNRPTSADESAPWLKQTGATFVTLTQHGRLRGCIGSLQAHRSLLVDVKENALAAAFRDPRFSPLSEIELNITRVEVSLLSALQEMNFTDQADALAQLRPFEDGLVLSYHHHRGTFLPQVWESLPQPQTFLNALKRKAGLAEDFWDKEVKLARYTVEKWKEALPNEAL